MNKIKVAFILCCLLATFVVVQPLQANQNNLFSAAVRPDATVALDTRVYPALQNNLFSVASAAAARPDAIVPLDSWVYSALDKLESIKDITGYSLSWSNGYSFIRGKGYSLNWNKERQAWTRGELAVLTLFIYKPRDWQNTESYPQSELIDEAGVKDVIAALNREFQPEIAQGVLSLIHIKVQGP